MTPHYARNLRRRHELRKDGICIDEQHTAIDNAVAALRAVARGETLKDWALEQHASQLESVGALVASQAEKIIRLTQERDALWNWRADVTVALRREGGAFYEDVPNHIRELVARLHAVEAARAQEREVLKDAVQVARNYHMMLHDEPWKARLDKWEAPILAAEARSEEPR